MNDLIDRQWAIASAISGRVMILRSSESCEEKWIRTKEVRQSLLDVPSVSMPPARPKGKWIPDNLVGGGYWVCTSCKHPTEAFAADKIYKFCPFCGADMREELE